MPFFTWGYLRLYWVPFWSARAWSQGCWSSERGKWRVYHAQLGKFMVSYGRV